MAPAGRGGHVAADIEVHIELMGRFRVSAGPVHGLRWAAPTHDSDGMHMETSQAADIRALTFDVFGTVVDWRGSVIRDLEELGVDKDLDADWPADDLYAAEVDPIDRVVAQLRTVDIAMAQALRAIADASPRHGLSVRRQVALRQDRVAGKWCVGSPDVAASQYHL